MIDKGLPPGWVRATLGDVSEPKISQAGPDTSENSFVYVDIGCIGPTKTISTRQRVAVSDAPSRARQKLRTGDVLVSMTRPNLNAVAMVPKEFDGAIGSTGFHVLRTAIADPGFLFAVVRSPAFVSAMTETVQGALYPAVRPADIRNFEIGLPPLPEQKRIVAKIEELTARSRRAKEALDAVPPLLDQLRQSILAAAFRGDLTAAWRARNRASEPAGFSHLATDDELPNLPPTWRWVSLGSLITRIEAGASFSCDERPPGPDEVGVLKVSAVSWGEYDERESKTCTTSERVTDALFVQNGDFLFSRANTIELVGACVIAERVSHRIMLSDKILRIRFVDVSQEWILYMLRSPWGRREIERLASGNQHSMRNIGQDRIREIRLPVPPPAEAHAAVELIRVALNRAETIRDKVVTSQRRIAKCEQALLAQAFRGELVPQDPNDEPASVLLERIRVAGEQTTAAGSQPRRKLGQTANLTGRSEDEADAKAVTPIRREPAGVTARELDDIDPKTLLDEVFSALWTLGPLEKEDAVRRVAAHLRKAGHVRFERLRSDGPLFGQILSAIEAAVKAGRLDRPKRGYVRACKPDAADFTADDWRHALVASLGAEPTDRDEALRAAAEWAREHLGLAFERLRADGQIAEGLRSAINSAIRRGEVIRHDARRISRAPAEAQAAPARAVRGRA